MTGSLGLANILQLTIIAGATVLGFMGTFRRDARLSLGSNLLFILAIMRFASSKPRSLLMWISATRCFQFWS